MALPGKRFTAYGSAILLVLATLTVTTAATAAAAPGPKELCGPGSEIDFDPGSSLRHRGSTTSGSR